MGQVYVEISASVVNEMMGISTLNGSGAGGSETVAGNINWSTNGGFTGLGWFFDQTPLQNWWNQVYSGGNEYVTGTSYTNDASGFQSWMNTETPPNLNAALENWSNEAKVDFLKANTDVFVNCV